MSIKSSDLKKDVTLQRGSDVLTVLSVKKDGRKIIAVCQNQKGKKEELSVSDLYYSKTKVINQDKPTPAEVGKAKAKEVINERKPKGKSTITYQRRGQGILTTVRDPEGKTLWSSWVRRPLEAKKKAA